MGNVSETIILIPSRSLSRNTPAADRSDRLLLSTQLGPYQSKEKPDVLFARDKGVQTQFEWSSLHGGNCDTRWWADGGGGPKDQWIIGFQLERQEPGPDHRWGLGLLNYYNYPLTLVSDTSPRLATRKEQGSSLWPSLQFLDKMVLMYCTVYIIYYVLYSIQNTST